MPPSERLSHLSLKLTPGERELLEQTASERGISLSDAARLMMFGTPPIHRHRPSKPGTVPRKPKARRGRKVDEAQRPKIRVKA
jgi:hypothetical protein